MSRQFAEQHITIIRTFLIQPCHRTCLLLWSMPLYYLVQITVTLLYGIADYNSNCLQRIQNGASPVVKIMEDTAKKVLFV